MLPSPSVLRKVAGLNREERRTAWTAFVLLPVISASLKWGSLARTSKWLKGRLGSANKQIPHSGVTRSAARMVEGVARYHPVRSACLAQSVTLWYLLARRGISSEVKIGVRKNDKGFGAHAWVEAGGEVLLDEPDVAERFSVIGALSADSVALLQ